MFLCLSFPICKVVVITIAISYAFMGITRDIYVKGLELYLAHIKEPINISSYLHSTQYSALISTPNILRVINQICC